jgi:hypothetical protein
MNSDNTVTDATVEENRPAKPRRRIDVSTIGLIAILLVVEAGVAAMYLETRRVQRTIDAVAKPTAAGGVIDKGQSSLVELEKTIVQTRQLVARVNAQNTTVNVSNQEVGDPFEYVPQLPDPDVGTEPVARDASVPDPRAVLAAQADKIVVQSVLIGPARRSCLLDGNLYFEGQTIGPFTVESIAPEQVVLRSGTFTFVRTIRR